LMTKEIDSIKILFGKESFGNDMPPDYMESVMKYKGSDSELIVGMYIDIPLDEEQFLSAMKFVWQAHERRRKKIVYDA